MRSAGILSLSLRYPSEIIANDFFRDRHADAVAGASERGLAKLFAATAPRNGFDEAARPYASDPFRGAVERRWLSPSESTVDLEAAAAREALALAGLDGDDPDLLLSSAFLPDHVGIGNAVYVARQLGLRCPAWNVETACTGALAALRLAAAAVRAGEHEHVLVTVSCAYSRVNDPGDTLSWFLGDGAAAFVVGPTRGDTGVLASHGVHTGETCGTWSFALEGAPDGGASRIAMRAAPHTGRVLSDVAAPTLHACVDGALARAGVTLADVAFVATTTPTAWFADFVAAELGIERERTVSVFPRYANVGPVLVPTALAHGACAGRFSPGDLVLCFAIGSASSALATVMRWGDVRVGGLPRGSDVAIT